MMNIRLKQMFFLSQIFFYLLSVPYLSAQEPPIKWGKILPEDFTMNSFSNDTTTSAIILCDYGFAYFTKNLELVFERHVRIKLLSEDGYPWGTVNIPYYSKNKMQRIDDINGQVYHLTTNGKVKKFKMNKKSILLETVNDENTIVRFTLPELKPGIILEYQYKIISDDPKYMPDWYFQNAIPTRWSEYRIHNIGNYEYKTVFPKEHKFYIDESTPYQLQIAIQVPRRYMEVSEGIGTTHRKNIFTINGTKYRRAMKDIPAIKEHPFMTTLKDYRIQMKVRLSKILNFNLENQFLIDALSVSPMPAFKRFAGAPNELRILANWKDLSKELMNSNQFGKQIQKYEIIQKQTENMIKDIDGQEKKMKAIYNFVQSKIKWNGQYQILASQDIDTVFQEGLGNNAEIALILISMLKDAGLTARPVLISTRSHGKIEKVLPILNQFNHVLVHVDVDDQVALLDPRDPQQPPHLLPVEALNHDGWLMDETNPRWVKIVSPAKYEHFVSLYAELNDDATMTAKIKSIDRGYSALAKRQKLQEKGKIDFIKNNLFSDFSTIQIDSFSIQNQNIPENDLLTSISFSSADLIRPVRDSLIFKPMILGRVKSNPFTSSKRSYPVDFAYPQDLTYSFILTIPEGYDIIKKPENIILVLPGDAGKCSRLTEIDGNTFHLTIHVEINKVRFNTNEYKGLQEFYDGIVQAYSETVVFRKTN